MERFILLVISTLASHNKEFVWKVRGYNSVQEMNYAQVQKWNETVDKDDDVYVLGDLMLGDLTNINFIKQLKGKIHIVLGNHDTDNRQKEYLNLPNMVEMAWAIKLRYKKYHFILSHFPMITSNFDCQNLKQTTLNLFGHTHQSDNFYNNIPFMYHVGVDSHNGYPVLLDNIIKEMSEKV